jgi:hypothetical protein
MAVDYKAHTTLSALQTVAMASSDVLDDSNYATAIETLINDVSERVDEYLGYQVIVNNYRHDIRAEDWKYDRMQDLYAVDAQYYPIVEISTSVRYEPGNAQNSAGFITAPTTITAGIVWAGSSGRDTSDSTRFEVANEAEVDDTVVTYFAGYKRSDQNLAALQSQWATLSTAPSDLPKAVKRATERICLAAIAEVSQGIGQRQIQNMGDRTITIETIDETLFDRELSRIKHLRRFIG